MADASRRTAAPEQGSYKSKLQQPSETDQLHARDQSATKFKLPPSQDAGPNKSWAPGGSTQSAVDARHKFSGDRQGSTADEDYQLPEGSTIVAQPTHVDDRDAGGGDGAATGPNKSWAPGGSTQSAVDARHKFSGDRQDSAADEDYQLPEGSIIVAQPQHVDEPRSDDSSAGPTVKAGQSADKQKPVNDVVASESKSQNPLAAAAASVASTAAAATKPVAAVVGQLKSVMVGSGVENIDGDDDDLDKESEGLKIAISEYVEVEGDDKVLAAAVL